MEPITRKVFANFMEDKADDTLVEVPATLITGAPIAQSYATQINGDGYSPHAGQACVTARSLM